MGEAGAEETTRGVLLEALAPRRVLDFAAEGAEIGAYGYAGVPVQKNAAVAPFVADGADAGSI